VCASTDASKICNLLIPPVDTKALMGSSSLVGVLSSEREPRSNFDADEFGNSMVKVDHGHVGPQPLAELRRENPFVERSTQW
jgi:hypothetical protein